MVQTWHTFKKFSLPSPNPLHCKRGWHIPKNWSLCFWVLPSTLRNSIVKDHSFPFVGKTLVKGMLCYPSNYLISRESFISWAFAQSLVFFDADGAATFSKDSTQKLTECRLWCNEIRRRRPIFLDLFPGSWPHLRHSLYGDGNLSQRFISNHWCHAGMDE